MGNAVRGPGGGKDERTVTLLENSSGHIASGAWRLNVSRTYSGYKAFLVVVTGLDNYSATSWPSINCTASSGTAGSTDLTAICATDDVTRKYAGVFRFSNCNEKSTTISISGGGSYMGWGYQIYGIA